LLGGNGGEVGQVLLNLALGADVAQQLDDGAASGTRLGVGAARVGSALVQRSRRSTGNGTRSQRRDGVWCGERSEGLGGSSPHSGAKGQHFGHQHAAASIETSRVAGGNVPLL
jgi:hypothetical protein